MTGKKDAQQMLEQFFGGEVNYFYQHFAEYDPDRKINITLSDSIFDAAMSMDLPIKQQEILRLQGKDVTDSLNGSVVLCKDMDRDGIQIIFSRRAFEYDDGVTLLGTINHEYTHANDFFDFARYLGTSDSDEIISNEYWRTLGLWSEFHARRNGFRRVLGAATGEKYAFPPDYMENEIQLLKERWQKSYLQDELYELMQMCGRYSVLEELDPGALSGFDVDMLQGFYSGMKRFVAGKIYRFCMLHTDFDSFIKDADVFRLLVSA